MAGENSVVLISVSSNNFAINLTCITSVSDAAIILNAKPSFKYNDALIRHVHAPLYAYKHPSTEDWRGEVERTALGSDLCY